MAGQLFFCSTGLLNFGTVAARLRVTDCIVKLLPPVTFKKYNKKKNRVKMLIFQWASALFHPLSRLPSNKELSLTDRNILYRPLTHTVPRWLYDSLKHAA